MLKRLALAGGALLLCVLLAEGIVRVALPQNLILIHPEVWIPHDEYGWTTAPDVDVELSAGESPVRFRTDARGYRIGAKPPPADPELRILGVGDSFLQAIEVDYEDTIGAVLEERLAQETGRSVRVVNAGVAGWTPSHYLLKVRDELRDGDYDAVVVFFYLGNDVVRKRVDRFEPRAPTMRHDFRLPRGLSAGELVQALLYPLNDFLEERSHLFALVRDRALLLRMRFGLTNIRMPEVLDRRNRFGREWDLTAGICVDLAKVAASAGVPVLFALLPSIHEVDREFVDEYVGFLGLESRLYDPDQPATLMTRRLRAHGLDFVDATPSLREAVGGERLYDRVTVHFSPRGHRVAAEAVLPALLRLVGADGD